MVEVKRYQLTPTKFIPNSPWPVLHYPGALSPNSGQIAVNAYEAFSRNGWQTQWIFRYGPTQKSHYHSGVHECMAVLSGSAIIRFGVADATTADDKDIREVGGVEVHAQVGDVFVIPAGVAHKTFNPTPSLPFRLLTPGNGHSVEGDDTRQIIADIELSGFTMIGAYPENGGDWDFQEGGDHLKEYEEIWSVIRPENDPVWGKAEEGLCGQWVDAAT